MIKKGGESVSRKRERERYYKNFSSKERRGKSRYIHIIIVTISHFDFIITFDLQYQSIITRKI